MPEFMLIFIFIFFFVTNLNQIRIYEKVCGNIWIQLNIERSYLESSTAARSCQTAFPFNILCLLLVPNEQTRALPHVRSPAIRISTSSSSVCLWINRHWTAAAEIKNKSKVLLLFLPLWQVDIEDVIASSAPVAATAIQVVVVVVASSTAWILGFLLLFLFFCRRLVIRRGGGGGVFRELKAKPPLDSAFLSFFFLLTRVALLFYYFY